MTDADDTTILQERLRSHRATLAVLLRQVAAHTAAYAPPAQISGIAEARAAIAQLKAQLRAAGVAVEDQPGDLAADAAAINRAAALALLDRLPLDIIPTPATLPPGSRMLLRYNPQFVGREGDFIALATALKAGGVAAITTGIAGVGKTQLAAEFAHRYGQFFAGGVFWLSFADPAGVAAEIAACGGAGALELYRDIEGLSQAEQVAKVVAAWAQELPRLLIFDNCDDVPGTTAEQLLDAWLPTSGGCRVLVTSRHGQWRSRRNLIAHHLDMLPRAESIALLRGHRDDLGAADAAAIAETLGDLPLALSLAGSYLDIYRDEEFGQPGVYLANLRQQLLGHRSLDQGDPLSATRRVSGVRAAFDLSYQQLQPSDPIDTLAIAALARAAHLAPGEPFPRTLLLAALGAASADEAAATQRADALRRLGALGLLEGAASATLRIHRLIAAFARDAIQDDAALTAIEAALDNLAARLNIAGYPQQLAPIQPQLRYVTDRARDRDDVQASRLCNNLGYLLESQGDLHAARPYYERALAIRETVLGAEHPDTANSLNNLGYLLKAQGDLAAARPYYERALAINETVLGAEHPDTALSLNNLGYLLKAQGDLRTARPYYERALAIREAVLGAEHPDTAQSLNNLGALLHAQGDVEAARPYYERALAINETVLGAEHPDTARSLSNLGALLHAQGDVEAARPYFERALVIREIALGPDHPDTARSLWWLGTLLRGAGDRAGARAQLQRAVAIYTRALGEQHPTTQQCQRQLRALDAAPPTTQDTDAP